MLRNSAPPFENIMKATLQHYRQSPRKVRLVGDLVKGKNVARALSELDVLPKRASVVMKKLINSATANAKENSQIEKENLIVENVTVDKGRILKRFRARARGSASPIRKRTSHITLTLKEVTNVEGAQKEQKEGTVSEKKTAKPSVQKTAPEKVEAKKADVKKSADKDNKDNKDNKNGKADNK